MNDVYACLVVAKEAAMTVFLIVCIVAVAKAWIVKEKTKKDGE